ncbi:hypothetical protein [Paenibacillus turpanensis]|uniref:hypothetical protein n=1 Tax=Paenibacillus turpanensis TaxID=2689078 RepID=UPI001407926D|nr:hypothetical protein [Paenibacillus turpanensis]
MRGRRFSVAGYIIAGLIVIGVLELFLRNPSGMLIPLLVFGLVFYFYKNPPKLGRRGGFQPGRQRETKRRNTFRVIPGRKPDDEEPPKYH